MDWFAVELTAGGVHEIDLKAWDSGSGTLFDPELFGIHDATGALLAGTGNNNAGGSFNSRVAFAAEDASVG
ncbi:MAG: hypothetical protein F4X35_08555 [Alphaproteobacteria bacterium]|nr:hypothetical protein [Alphaproteobacteria bacterium]